MMNGATITGDRMATKAPPESSLASALELSLAFVREHWLRFAAISITVLIPCFWHREIEADDLGSHLYNAWLVQLIHRARLPGVWLVHPWTNVLFDYMLSGLGG